MSVAAAERWRAEFGRVAAGLPGRDIPWVRSMRESAIARFDVLGYPKARDEEWKYTAVAPIERADWRIAPEAPAQAADAAIAALALADDARLLVFVNGRFAPGLSRIGALPAGCRLEPLSAALARGDDRLGATVTSLDEARDGFVALNRAFAADGLRLDLEPGCVLEEPVYVVCIAEREAGATQLFNVVQAGARAGATVVEYHAGTAASALLSNVCTRIVLGEGAAVEHHVLQDLPQGAFHVDAIDIRQAAHSVLNSWSHAFGATLARTRIATEFAGEHCEATLNGFYMLDGRQHIDHHTLIDHASPRGTSRQVYKGIVGGRARAVFNGRVVVRPDAQQTDAQQSNRNLLLSPHAEIDTKPQLEIHADDVKCAHGATVTQLDETQMFYLRSRGIDDAAARSLLTYGFAEDLIRRVRIAPLRRFLDELLISRLPDGKRVRELL